MDVMVSLKPRPGVDILLIPGCVSPEPHSGAFLDGTHSLLPSTASHAQKDSEITWLMQGAIPRGVGMLGSSQASNYHSSKGEAKQSQFLSWALVPLGQ